MLLDYGGTWASNDPYATLNTHGGIKQHPAGADGSPICSTFIMEA